MAKVSILMNGYNSEKFLRSAINSVYAQTFTDWEIIFIDNCSTDSTKEIVDSYNNKIKYHKTKDNLNLGSARNYGLSYCSADYLAFLDTDDIWFENKLEMQMKVMDEDTAVVYSSVITIDCNSKALRKTHVTTNPNFYSLLRRYDINMQSVIINLKLANVEFNEKLSYCPDFDLFMNLAAKNLKFKTISTPLVKYRIHDNSLSSKTNNIQLQEVSIVIQTLKEKYPNLYFNYECLFNNAIDQTKHLIKAKFFLKKECFYKAASEFFFLAKFNPKYLVVSMVLFFPVVNWLFHKLLFKKYF
jgi:glycosyltransferase involved in cell wall biosynthesis